MWGPNVPYFGFWRGFWILDFGSWGYRILDFGDFGFWILDLEDFGFWILGIFGILDFGFWDFGFWIFGILGILDFGFLEHYVADLYVQSLDLGIWGFWILDFGDLGFWILEIFGVWGTGDFGLASCDKNFGCYIRKEDCARRTGSADSSCKLQWFRLVFTSSEWISKKECYCETASPYHFKFEATSEDSEAKDIRSQMLWRAAKEARLDRGEVCTVHAFSVMTASDAWNSSQEEWWILECDCVVPQQLIFSCKTGKKWLKHSERCTEVVVSSFVLLSFKMNSWEKPLPCASR